MIENSVVSISKPNLLQFFYPDYVIKEELEYHDSENNIIYQGSYRPDLTEYLTLNTNNYISLTGNPDYDLDNREIMLELVYSKHNRKPTKKSLESIDYLEEEEFIYCCKVCWVTGVWISSEKDVSVYDLFQASNKSQKEFLKTYFELEREYPFYMIESSFFTFLTKVSDRELDSSHSSHYSRLIQTFRSNTKTSLKPSVMAYMKDKIENESLSFSKLLTNLR